MMTIINDEAQLFTLINTFHSTRDQQSSIAQALRSFTEDVARGLPGFIAASVHVSLDGTRVVNYVQWRSKADLDAMLGRADAQAHMREVGALADRVDPVAYRVQFVGSKQ